MEFKISEGPWKKLFEGKFDENDVEIYSNPESVILVLIYEREKDRIAGAVVELFKVFYSIGESEAFVETLPREVILLTKHDQKETIKFLLLGSTPSYVKWNEKEFIDEAEGLLKKLKNSSSMIKEVSKAYEITLKELAESSEHIREAFFSQPLLVPVVSTASHPQEEGEELRAITKGEINFGLTKEKMQVVEPLSLFTKTIVSEGQNPKDRRHVLHILAESAMLSGITLVLFDWKGEFSGLGESSKEREGLQKYRVKEEPIGFPLKELKPAQNIVVDLNIVNAQGLTEAFGAGENPSNSLILSTIEKVRVKSIKELIDRVQSMTPDANISEFDINKAVRMLTLMDVRYPGLFVGENNIEEISKSSIKSIGRAAIINLSGMDRRAGLLVVHNIIKGMLLHYHEKGKSPSLKSTIILPEASRVITSNESSNKLAKEIVDCLSVLSIYGVQYYLETEKIIDLPEELTKKAEAKITIVSGNDVSINLKDRKSYRVLLRPGLSNCTEK